MGTFRVAPQRKKRRRLLLFQLLLAVGLLLVIWFSFGRNVLSPQGEMGVPKRLGEMELVRVTKGAEALSQLNRLHGTDIRLTSAYIVEYSHALNPYHQSEERVTVWVGSAESSNLATELIKRMLQGIQRGGSGFSNLRRLVIAEQEVFQVDGPGGQHFFYQSREPDKLVWLAIEADDTLPILEEALKIF